MGNPNEHMPDPEKIKEILDVVSDKVPHLLKELSAILYSPDQAKSFGVSVATFYKELKAAGMSDDEAFELTKQYMSTLNIAGHISKFSGHEGHCHHDGPPDFIKKGKSKNDRE